MQRSRKLPDTFDPADAAAAKETCPLVNRLMGRKPEARFQFIQANARFVTDVDV